ncbi:hypothetical protein AXG93_3037s1030 [Marchantia polymorpha subsp. ruderalis]|uniref:Uncharacterized protein n=1 Tax=Marchantia polymorpha subsp. ruderalis TaxID=1480154 RepID=A0A176WL41_MARPO|nr:hypothetical protein AXG93_3037s1030 [Marchantia polymorpha subsp. ruderalis]
MGSPGRSGEGETLQDPEEAQACISPPSCSAHDITSMSDLPARRMKTKMWPMSPIETLTQEEVLSIANRDRTPVMIAVLDGDTSGEQYLCSNKRGASLPPEIAAEGSWAQMYYQQVAVLSDTLKGMQESFQPVWELAKSQQALLVSVEIYDGLLAIANQGMQVLFKSWSVEDRKAIVTKQCDFRTHKQADYYTVLKNYTLGNFESLDRERFKNVEDLLIAGETHLMQHAKMNGFQCPSGTKNLILLGADYAETVLANYGRVRQNLFLDPNKRCPQRSQSTRSAELTPQDSPGPSSPGTQTAEVRIGQNSLTGRSSYAGETINETFDLHSSESPPYSSLGPGSQSPLGSPLVLTFPVFSESLRQSQPLPALDIPPSSPPNQSIYIGRTHPRSPESSPSSHDSQHTHSTEMPESSDTTRSPKGYKRPRL